MTRLYNDPAEFRDEAIAGFSAAYARYVERVPGTAGLIRRGGPRAGKVSLVVGGGSGHYPSYGGIVGAGFADACVLGQVFTSPSTEQVYRVASAAHGGAGVVLAFGNYAGDRLNFGAAQQRLVAEGIDTRIVYVTDDIASAGAGEAGARRGIAGTFVVYKIGGAAADRGADLDTVERLMRAANGATFSFGVAFGGCTLPGQPEPLFTVEPGQMEMGLGVHGEPGVRTAPWLPAADLADLLVDPILAERPAGAGGRAAVIVNGLGATKYEELFLLYGHIHRRLVDAGVEPVLPEVGELITSLDMAGCSLSVTWLDDELEPYWTAPADTVAFRRGEVPVTAPQPPRRSAGPRHARDVLAERVRASDSSVAAAAVAYRALSAMADIIVENERRLGELDTVAGDGDHGAGMVRGMRAALAEAGSRRTGVGTMLRRAGGAFGDRAGGTSGMLWGVLLTAVGESLGDTGQVRGAQVAAALRHGADAVQRAGRASLGDKTMLDALFPFVDELQARLDAGDGLVDAWRKAAETAVRAADATAGLRPRIGRARPLGDRSLGSPDPGAVSMGLALSAAGEVLTGAPGRGDGGEG
jgi:dihydroxyacetone kinase